MCNKQLSQQKHMHMEPQTFHHSYILLTLKGSGSIKTNSLFNLIRQQLNIEKIYSYAKDPYDAKYQFLINETEVTD